MSTLASLGRLTSLVNWKARSRGFTMIETVLVLAVALSMLIGGIMYYMQMDGSAQKNEKLNTVTAIAAEMKTLSRQFVNLDDIEDPTASPAVSAGKNVKDGAIANITGLHVSTFANIDVETDGSTFFIHLFDLNDGVCRQLRIADYGPGTLVASATDCEVGTLSIFYEF